VVSIFISIRFEYRMAIAALAAMIHDVIVVVGVYSVFGFEVTPATVIAFLTILGYSLYDTIVVFDRVQENEGKYAGIRMPYEDIVNISMNQVLMRSINTSISSILPVVSLLVIGSGLLGAVTLREFALALLIGMLSGIYSSIFVATPLLAALKANVGRKARRERLTGENLRAAVIGSGVTGRVAAAPAAIDDEHDDDAKTAAILEPAGKLLTHPPRPRKKKRR
jgi:preprotein translocase subunit SecF